jgi:hypothetical protein
MGRWIKQRKDAFHNLLSSSIVIRMVKSRKMRWSGYVALMARRGMYMRH